MKKLFTLIGALLLWQAMAVAQNYLHISSGESTEVVPMAELDSVTVCVGVSRYGYLYLHAVRVGRCAWSLYIRARRERWGYP